jgi:uncharacterized membrane protein (UPF0182 family)
LLQKVLVSFGDQIGFDTTVKGALDQVFGGNSGDDLGTGINANDDDSGSGTGSGTGSAANNASLQAALRSAQDALRDAQAALRAGDFTAYGKAQDRLKSAIEAAISAQNR